MTKHFDETRQGVKQEIYNYVDSKRAEASARRIENGGYDTEKSKQLDLEANKLNEITRWVDMGLGAVWGMTSSVALQDLNNNQKILQIPIRQSRFYGTATNVQDYANQLFLNGYISTDGYYSSAYSAVHEADPVGSIRGILGGNQRLKGNCFLCYAHSSYFAEIPPSLIKINGKFEVNELYKDYVKKWGEVDPNNPINKSAPVLIRPTLKNSEDKYFNERPY